MILSYDSCNQTRRMGWAGSVAHIEAMRKEYKAEV
jgi:hypothetical protein